MGIPSYYKKLCEQIPGLVMKTKPQSGVQWLWVDFNCMIYHCLQRDDIPTYPQDSIRDNFYKVQWENMFIKEIEKYLQKVIARVGPTEGVYVAVDGVVPLAKMKQQRMRRFKGVWERFYGPAATAATATSEVKWDKNAITPGTTFMNRLCFSLSKMKLKEKQNVDAKSRKPVKYIFSGVNEPGEGEHKIMDAWRNLQIQTPRPHIENSAIYGLDADLIVLGLLNRGYLSSGANVWLFREDVQEGKIVRDADGEEQFTWFSLQKLSEHLELRNLDSYLFAMTALGNDFLPSGFSLKLREDGHDRLLMGLEYFEKKRQTFFRRNETNNNRRLDFSERGGLAFFFKGLAQDEEKRIENFIKKKLYQAGNIGDQTAIGQQNWPLAATLHEEGSLIDLKTKTLLRNWKELYLKKYFHGATIEEICRVYLIGLQWVWNYYNGCDEPDKWSWYYPWHMPPLWCWLAEYLTAYEDSSLFKETSQNPLSIPALPIQQLTMVLPPESYDLIPDEKYRQFPLNAPWYFPKKYRFFSAGRRYFWECEADIPMPSLDELNAATRNGCDKE